MELFSCSAIWAIFLDQSSNYISCWRILSHLQLVLIYLERVDDAEYCVELYR
jgi:hypothetical protein